MTVVTGLVGAAGAVDRLGAAWVSAIPGDYDPSSGHGPDWGKAAPAGILVWLFLGVCLFFLIKSMNKHIKKVAKNAADGDAAGSPGASAAGTGTGETSDTDAASPSDADGAAGTADAEEAADSVHRSSVAPAEEPVGSAGDEPPGSVDDEPTERATVAAPRAGDGTGTHPAS